MPSPKGQRGRRVPPGRKELRRQLVASLQHHRPKGNIDSLLSSGADLGEGLRVSGEA
jgi:hypothetical protein